MHRFTSSIKGRTEKGRTEVSSTDKTVQAQYASQPFTARPFVHQVFSYKRALSAFAASVTTVLMGCQGAPAPDATANTAIDTAEVFNTPPALTIVAPEGTHPDNSAFIQVAENSLNVTQVAAEDAPGSKLIYRLQDGEDKDKFMLDENTGTLRFKDLPDWENPKDADANNNYMLLWQVISSTGDARSQFMVIQVTDIPE